MSKEAIFKIYQNAQTVFTANELGILLNESNSNNLKARLNYFVKQGYLLNLRRGIYSKNQDYSVYELGNKIYKPSYLSLDTILAKNGVIFQYDSRHFFVSYLSREIKVRENFFIYKKIKDEVLFSQDGIIFGNGYFQASLERAFLDKIYLNPDFYFDNLSKINWEKAFELAKIYQSKKIIKTLNSYFQNAE